MRSRTLVFTTLRYQTLLYKLWKALNYNTCKQHGVFLPRLLSTLSVCALGLQEYNLEVYARYTSSRFSAHGPFGKSLLRTTRQTFMAL